MKNVTATKSVLNRISISLVAFLLLLIPLALFGCSQDKTPSQDDAKINVDEIEMIPTDKSEEYSEIDGSLYRNTKYKFRIKFPEGWTIMTGDGPNVVQKAVDDSGANINIVIKELPAEYGELFSSINELFALEEFVSNIEESMVDNDFKVISYGETKIDNKPAHCLKGSMSYSAVDVTVDGTLLMYYLLHDNILYLITAGTTTNDFPVLENTLKASVSSFVIEDWGSSPTKGDSTPTTKSESVKKPYTSSDGFQADFSNTPDVNYSMVEEERFKIPTTFYSYSVKDTVQTVSIHEYPDGLIPDEYLRDGLANSIATVMAPFEGAELLSLENDGETQGYPSATASFSVPRDEGYYTAYVKVIMKDSRLFRIIAMGDSDAESEHFVSSFKLQ